MRPAVLLSICAAVRRARDASARSQYAPAMLSPSSDRDVPSAAARFAWPPRRGGPSAPVRPPEAAQSSRPRSPAPPIRRSVWNHFECAFLDLAAAPFALRAQEAGWAPDPPDAYCPRCGRTLGGERDSPDGCRECAGVKFAWDRMVRLGEYAGPLRTWVHEVKFTRWRRLGIDLGERLGLALLDAWRAEAAESAGPPVIVPVPDHPLRRVFRGIDHAAVIAAGVRRATGWAVCQPLHRRLGRSQLSVPASQRAANVARAFGIREGCQPVAGAGLVVVVDDVVTTGATMRTCCRMAAKSCRSRGNDRGPRVWAACLGRAVPVRATGGHG